MKNIYSFIFISFCFLFSSLIVAQPVPPFKMLLTNGKILDAKDLPHGKPLILIYFAPDCEHCQILMNALFNKLNNFKSSEIVLITFKPINEVANFEKQFQTNKYPNIIVGTEVPALYLQMYFHLTNTPFTALYNKQGQYVYSYRKETPIDDLISRLKMLK